MNFLARSFPENSATTSAYTVESPPGEPLITQKSSLQFPQTETQTRSGTKIARKYTSVVDATTRSRTLSSRVVSRGSVLSFTLLRRFFNSGDLFAGNVGFPFRRGNRLLWAIGWVIIIFFVFYKNYLIPQTWKETRNHGIQATNHVVKLVK